ncbi:alpha/beta fold hydrolase [Nocardiopsis algeriensis]|uniref:Pimeloyl-ACP methyl ester carboxylesterase n=1 Tax=Nocardiopsis algeriensis TaxID=1478215 RepID=A0A841ING4_9ACTN|nr:pimeloyl-ACP methyl ester carboxylesterase [Nocardiopsis algeriensis]
MNPIYRSEEGERRIRQNYLQALEEWPVPAERVRLPTCQGETFVLVSGPPDAPPVVLLHGSGANAAMWQGDVASWSRHLRVHAVDLVGEPGLSAPSRPPLDSGGLALWLDDVLDGLGLARTAVVGTSLGGWTALHYATRNPDRVTRLALLCPGGVGRQTTGRMLLTALPPRLFGSRGRRRSVQLVTGLDPRRDRAALDTVALAFAQFRPRTERLPVFSDEELGRLDMPVLVVVGGRDVMFDSAETARRMRARVPHARVHVLPEAGHALLHQTETVEEFLRG